MAVRSTTDARIADARVLLRDLGEGRQRQREDDESAAEHGDRGRRDAGSNEDEETQAARAEANAAGARRSRDERADGSGSSRTKQASSKASPRRRRVAGSAGITSLRCEAELCQLSHRLKARARSTCSIGEVGALCVCARPLAAESVDELRARSATPAASVDFATDPLAAAISPKRSSAAAARAQRSTSQDVPARWLCATSSALLRDFGSACVDRCAPGS